MNSLVEVAEKIYSTLYLKGWRLLVLYHPYDGPTQIPIIFLNVMDNFKLINTNTYEIFEFLKPEEVKNSSLSTIEAIIEFGKFVDSSSPLFAKEE